MNNSFTNKNLKSENLDWNLIQSDMKNKLGPEIYESWLKKIDFIDEFNNYILLFFVKSEMSSLNFYLGMNQALSCPTVADIKR